MDSYYEELDKGKPVAVVVDLAKRFGFKLNARQIFADAVLLRDFIFALKQHDDDENDIIKGQTVLGRSPRQLTMACCARSISSCSAR